MLRGLRPFALAELRRRLGARASLVPPAQQLGAPAAGPADDEEAVRLELAGELGEALRLRTVVAVHLLGYFDVPRPLALLGDQSLRSLLGMIDTALALHRPGTFATFRISAAGSETPPFVRLRAAIAEQTGLTHRPDEADLLLRARRSVLAPTGWDVLVRLTPRPLATRPWRVHNMPGALNATVAAAMVELTQPRPADRFLNLLCGSGTLLIERLLRGPAAVAIGCDVAPAALAGARANLDAARLAGSAELLEMDATQLRFPAGSFDALCADLPWGQLSGSHRANVELYPSILAEAGRVARPGARLALLTHQMGLLEGVLPDLAGLWELEQVFQVYQGGLHPRLYQLRRVLPPTRPRASAGARGAD